MATPFAGLSFLVVGHVCRDLLAEGVRIGGTATYAALTAHRLGATARVVTAAATDLDLGEALAGIAVHCSPSPRTTAFHNVYGESGRQQRLLSWSGVIPSVPPEWQDSTVVLLGPVAREVPANWVNLFPRALLGVSPQGWMRTWDEQGQVHPCPWAEAETVLPRADVVVLSLDDVGGDRVLMEEYARRARLLVVTEGRHGAIVHWQGKHKRCPAWPTQEVDPTGAGDVFTAAFLLELAVAADPHVAADFANCVASFAVERPGSEGIPTWEHVEERWRRGRQAE